MDAKNLGLCLSPSLFALSSPPKSSLSRRGSFRRSNAINSPTTLSVAGNKELNEHMMSSRCLTELITRYKEIFTIATDMMHTCRFTLLEYGDPVPYQDIGTDGDGCGSYHSYIDDCIATVAKVLPIECCWFCFFNFSFNFNFFRIRSVDSEDGYTVLH